MQRAQRTTDNHALETAISAANQLGLPVLVAFVLTDDYPEANLRHYRFMAEGLRDVAAGCRRRDIGFTLRYGTPPGVVSELAQHAACVVCDGAYLRHLRDWRQQVARTSPACVLEVETDIVVPVEVASQKREYAARTIRKKVMGRLEDYLVLPSDKRPEQPASRIPSHYTGTPGGASAEGAHNVFDPGDPVSLCSSLNLDRSVPAVPWFLTGGEQEAIRRFERFLADRAHLYAENRNEPATTDTSYMSAYLHFGHISPVRLVIRMREAAQADGGIRDSVEGFVEELVVRRELAQNYVYFEPRYDRYEALPDWARASLSEHSGDERPALYSTEQLEHAKTDDPYWNAAMREMLATGYMHNYMRMYWGKKILEWSEEPAEAFRRTLYLNNRYFIDGRDPASYANVAWIFGLHDRPWPERQVFGKVRSMKASGLERKCDMPGYIARVEKLEADARQNGE
ncbi:MAG: deoxyribodipyrimidine photolyase [Spirochaetes bacterium]|nr:deoxyribodipyrimidine photolyase [Spirochaetota bacterium]